MNINKKGARTHCAGAILFLGDDLSITGFQSCDTHPSSQPRLS